MSCDIRTVWVQNAWTSRFNHGLKKFKHGKRFHSLIPSTQNPSTTQFCITVKSGFTWVAPEFKVNPKAVLEIDSIKLQFNHGFKKVSKHGKRSLESTQILSLSICSPTSAECSRLNVESANQHELFSTIQDSRLNSQITHTIASSRNLDYSIYTGPSGGPRHSSSGSIMPLDPSRFSPQFYM